ncbi:hypothetical protein CHRY9390_01807 [Chryseobacterium aquaeductus]|uniref:Abortive infection protein-like C-terminal domain-containing protein n=1 Tax=Chryseobacterium aquaeductus TaxID=2675056 RepID=A0A9N8MG24_9FLAO|nr:hypothetical protein [Chryseobacterium aquaeductus]CAA7331126.1 hypothetical protein CHRY9390_01807 [Chryseobacterium potabilaquae]CAD7808335.1 hypothetical protein CHRY9390_01807 [Chryseobacterium aquaeductus]
MATFKTYSKETKGDPQSFIYDTLDSKVKNQINFIWKDFFEHKKFPLEISELTISQIFNIACREFGLDNLYSNGLFCPDEKNQLEKFIQENTDIEILLDIIHIIFTKIEFVDDWLKHNYFIDLYYTSKEAKNDLNTRFRENGIGYIFENSKILRVDNQFLHEETVSSTFNLINNVDYQNANEEYLKAHEHFKQKRNIECLNECLKAFETTMKIICYKNSWNYDKERDTSSTLINHLISNNFFKAYHESYLNSFKQILSANIPTIRNKNSGHGQGVEKKIIPDSLAKYMLYSTGAIINLIVETQNEYENLTLPLK